MLDSLKLKEPSPISDALEGNYGSAAVVTNTEPCSYIGSEILARGGSAVDAIITTLLCEGLTGLQNMGIGGGVFMMIYKRNKRQTFFLDAREAAPLTATSNMFNGNSSVCCTGGTSIAVPGELMGYWEAHQRFGFLPWKELFQPAIQMCKTGVPVNARLAKSFAHCEMEEEIMNSPTLRQLLAPNGCLPKAGEALILPALAKTLSIVAEDKAGAKALYDGVLTSSFLKDLKSIGSIIAAEDLANYKVNWYEPIATHLNGGFTMYAAPPPASGSLLSFIIQTLEGKLEMSWAHNLQNTLRIAETFKYAYALRTELGDPRFVDNATVLNKTSSSSFIGSVASKIYTLKRTESKPKHYGARYHSASNGGTINIVVCAPNGDVVVATSTINTLFGSLLASASTGIILNNEMDDFSSPCITNSFGVPPSEANFIEGGKRPLSSATPTIITGPNGALRMAIGAAGGTHITSAVAQVIINHLWLGMSLKQAVEMPRIHHQLLPMLLKYERGLPKSVVEGLENAKHKTKQIKPHSSVTAIANVNGRISAIYDYRRGGSTSGF